MRKHDVRKWLHACLDLLPVFLIPVFMIYSHRHDMTERTSVEISYQYESNVVESFDDLVEDNIYYLDTFVIEGDSNINHFVDVKFLTTTGSHDFNNPTFEIGETYFGDYSAAQFNYLDVHFNPYDLLFDGTPQITFYFTNEETYQQVYYNGEYLEFNDVVFVYSDDFGDYIRSTQNLPQMTDFNVINSVVVNDTDNDIMSVFMDDFNHAINKYFNMGNVFNLGDIYDWFNINIFGGNAPTIIYSIWNIALYEFVMDLLFLLYGLFMWFIDMIENVMNKPFKSVK